MPAHQASRKACVVPRDRCSVLPLKQFWVLALGEEDDEKLVVLLPRQA
jgi:hypothetical protein